MLLKNRSYPVLQTTQSVRLFRAGSPDEGRSFWTPSEAYARVAHPEGAMHEAKLQSGFTMKTFLFCRNDPLVEGELAKREADVLVFRSPDGREEEYCVLSPNCIKIVQ